MDRTWTEIGADFTAPGDDREEVEAILVGLTWRSVKGVKSLPALPGLGIKAAISELRIPKVSAIATDGYLERPDPDGDGTERAYYSIYGIEGNYTNGRARIYLLDRGSSLTVLASELLDEVPA